MLTQCFNCKLIFEPLSCILQAFKSKKTIGFTRLQVGFYSLHLDNVAESSGCVSSFHLVHNLLSNKLLDSTLWHLKSGHLSQNVESK